MKQGDLLYIAYGLTTLFEESDSYPIGAMNKNDYMIYVSRSKNPSYKDCMIKVISKYGIGDVFISRVEAVL
jgi:hypothetical protein